MWENVFFEPWVGASYGKEDSFFKKKIMVLGDSHYCNKSDVCTDCGDRDRKIDCIDFTKEVIGDYLDENSSGTWKKTFTSFLNGMLGRDIDSTERRLIFDSIIFYNYLQVSAGDDAYSANKYDHRKKEYLSAFYEVLERYEPDVVISWGNRVWDVLPNNWKDHGEAVSGPILDINGKKFSSYLSYPYSGKSILLIGVNHPSVAFERDYHSKIFSELVLKN